MSGRSRMVAVALIAMLGLAVAIGRSWSSDAPGRALAEPRPAAGLPRSPGACAARPASGTSEPRPDNRQANATTPATAVRWSSEPETTRWSAWIATRARVTGAFTGTTDQILGWAACRWALDPDLLRAVAAQESDWHQAKIGDDGESFGIMQVKDHYGDGTPAWGGYPDTSTSTALNVDFYGAYIRSCIDGDFDDGGQWLYHGRSIDQVIAAHGFDYALWGCVGSWYSGDWYDAAARGYIDKVKRLLSERYWQRYTTP